MHVYVISYDLNEPGQDYEDLFETLKSFGSWWHYLDSTWLVETELTSNEMYEKIKKVIDENDIFLILKTSDDYYGYLPKKAWKWIKDRM